MHNEEIDYTDAKQLRLKAEEQLNRKSKKVENAIVEIDSKKLLHELQVHQIELEMQNDELRQAYETAEVALKKYTMLYDLAPMGYFTLDSNALITELNFTGADMLGYKRFSLVNSNLKLFITDDSLPVFNDFFMRVYTLHGKESCKVQFGSENGSKCEVYMEGIVTGDDQKCLLSVIDISDFKS
jgi:PAS domain S-box-containing protein